MGVQWRIIHAGSADYVPSPATSAEWEGFGWSESGEPVPVDGSGDAVAAAGDQRMAEAAAGETDAERDSDGAAASPVQAEGRISLESCLTAFFAPEAITWACPKELKVSRGTQNHTSRRHRGPHRT